MPSRSTALLRPSARRSRDRSGTQCGRSRKPGFCRTLAAHVEKGHDTGDAVRLREQAEQARRQSEEVRQLMNAREPLPAQPAGEK